jgi:hypothetical protein
VQVLERPQLLVLLRDHAAHFSVLLDQIEQLRLELIAD